MNELTRLSAIARSKAYHQRNYRSTGTDRYERAPSVPEDVERVEFHVPCLRCGAARECQHRRWLA